MLLQGKDLKIEYIFDPNKTKKTVFYLFQSLKMSDLANEPPVFFFLFSFFSVLGTRSF